MTTREHLQGRVNALSAALSAAQAEWAQAHLTDLESEDARQRVLDAAEALASAEEALAGALRDPYGGAPMGPIPGLFF